MIRKEIEVCMFLAAGLALGSGCGQASGGRKEIEVSGIAETSVSEALEDRSGEEGERGDRAGGKADVSGGAEAGQNGREAAADGGSADGDGSGNGNGNGNGTEIGTGNGIGTGKAEALGNEDAEDMRKRFGKDCIGEQTFEAELSEYDGKVWFVPFGPGQGNPDFHIQLMQNGTVMGEIKPYVPEGLQGKTFASLDAVSFYDMNFDGCTDILLIETYGDTTFAAVYYGFDRDGEEYERSFTVQEQLSDRISAQAGELSVAGVRKALGDTRKNGKFAGYQEAYGAVARLLDMSDEDGAYNMTVTYGLIDVDGNGTPELTAGVDGYYTSLYTYSGGKVCTLIDKWSYGVMGNAGYEYAPGNNSLRNYNTDYAGAILYTTYMAVRDGNRLETVAEVKTVNFDDVNGNGVLDEDEIGSVGYYGVNYLNGKEASVEECSVYDAGEYEMIRGDLSLEGVLKELGVR